MVKHTQTIRWLLQTNCLSVFDHFAGLVIKGLMNVEKDMTCSKFQYIFFQVLNTHPLDRKRYPMFKIKKHF